MKVKPLVFAIDEEGIWYSTNPNYLQYAIELTKDDNGNPYQQTKDSLDYRLLFHGARNSWANNLKEAFKHQQDFHKEVIESYFENDKIKPLEFVKQFDGYWYSRNSMFLGYLIEEELPCDQKPFKYKLSLNDEVIHYVNSFEEAVEFFQKFHQMIIECYVERD